MKTISPDDLIIIEGLPPKAKKGDKVSIDSEFYSQEKKKLHRPHGTFAYLGASFDGKTVYYITDEALIQKFLDRIEKGVWIFHHAKYDITQLRSYANIPQRSRLWDTLLIEQIQFSGYYTDFGLADLVRRYLKVYMPKDVRKSFSDVGTASMSEDMGVGTAEDTVSVYKRELSREQLGYSCVDVAATWRIYKEQRTIIDETDLMIWKDIELPFLWTLIGMKGIKVDKERWIAFAEKNYNDALKIQKQYMDNPEILDEMSLDAAKKKKKFQGINLGSSDQVSATMKKLGIRSGRYTAGGKMSTQEDDIKAFAEEYEFVRDVLEFRGKMKLASTYGMNWIKEGYIEEDGRVYSSFKQMGAATGRLSSADPNVENIPIRETPEFRDMFIADDDMVLIDADWSAQEPRIFAYQSQDEKLIKIFVDKKDVYVESAFLMFGWKIDKKDPRRKERMKPTVLGASYGLTEYGMEKKYGIPKDEGRELLDTFFSTFDGAAAYKQAQMEKREFVQTIYGRKYWLNVYERGYENNSLNSPTQGSAADAMKIAGSVFYERVADAGYSDKVYVVNYVHDEILIECHKDLVEWAVENLRDVMVSVAEDMHEGIPADAEIECGHTWSEAHP